MHYRKIKQICNRFSLQQTKVEAKLSPNTVGDAGLGTSNFKKGSTKVTQVRLYTRHDAIQSPKEDSCIGHDGNHLQFQSSIGSVRLRE